MATSRPDQHLRAVPDPAAQLSLCNLEAEEGLLGALLWDREAARAAMGELADRFTGDDFYRPAHRTVYAAIAALAARGDPVDAVMVAEELQQQGTLADVGGAPFLHTLVQGVPVVANAGHYAAIVASWAQRRRLRDLGHRLVQAATEPSAQPEAVARYYARHVLEIAAPAPSPVEDRPTGPTLAPEALHGLAGEVVRTLAPQTEAHPAGMLAGFLVGFGNLIGPGPHALVGRARHPAKLYVLVVGASGKARKGTALTEIRPVLEQADPGWARRISSGLTTGEGLAHQFRDETTDRAGQLVDAGPVDKRLLVVEAEFGGVLAKVGRDGSILSAQLRELWDSDRAQIMTKNDPMVASGAHLGVVGQITREELLHQLTETEGRNGFANRFLYVSVRRTQDLPEGGNLDPAALDDLAGRVQQAAERARGLKVLRRSADARGYWALLYGELMAETGEGGLAAAVTSRADAQNLRLQVVYALLDGSQVIELPHVQAAHALWRYCEASALEIFGDALGDEVADQLLEHLRAAGAEQGLTLAEQRGLFGGHVGSERLAAARARLERAGLARTVKQETKGRPRHVTYPTARGATADRRRR